MSDALTTLLARETIRELLAEYCFRLDGYELDALGALFTADGRWISRNGEATGPAGITAFMGQLVPPPGPGTRRKHLTTNIVMVIEDAKVTVTSNFIVIRDTPAGPAIVVAGTYRDEVVAEDGRWLFHRRELFHDITGESGLRPT